MYLSQVVYSSEGQAMIKLMREQNDWYLYAIGIFIGECNWMRASFLSSALYQTWSILVWMAVLFLFVSLLLSAIYELLYFNHSMHVNECYMHNIEVLRFYYEKYCIACEMVRHLAHIMSPSVN